MAAKFGGIVHHAFHPDLDTTLCGLPVPADAEQFRASGDRITCATCRENAHKRHMADMNEYLASLTPAKLRQLREDEERERREVE